MTTNERNLIICVFSIFSLIGAFCYIVISRHESKQNTYWENVEKIEKEALLNKESGVAVMSAYDVQTWANEHPDVEIVQISTSGREYTIATVLWKRKEKK